jgi:hypothetical protein
MRRVSSWFGPWAGFVLLVWLGHPAQGQTLETDVYGDITYGVTRTAGQTANTFAVPTLDLFSRGQSGKLSLITEVIFDIPSGSDFSVDVDRMVLSYDVREWLQISGGKFNTALGYYNTAFPQGAAIFLLGIDRPDTISQYNDHALLPVLGVGLHAGGRIHAGRQAFTYDLELLNGRGSDTASVLDANDPNSQKAFNLRLRYEPGFLDGLIVGGNAYLDWIPPAPPDAVTMLSPQPFTLREQIFGAHVAYAEYPLLFILEGYVIQHLLPDGTTFTTQAAFAETGYAIRTVTPYLRAEYVNFPSSQDPFYALTRQQVRGDLKVLGAGAKWSPNATFSLKLELEGNFASADSSYSATTQAAFGF